ncbi:MAG TPA: tetratricopeptide repeat protein [Vicinamibacteria bacterium]|nr:tetratricopeptide repeat protein [Vicinamibacteria bacterium]
MFRRFSLAFAHALLLAALPAIVASAQDAAAAYARAVALHQAGDLEGAVRAYGEALVQDPRNPQLRSNLGAALAALGRYEEAIASYREALRLLPGDARIRTNLALAYYKSADIARAAEELQALHEAAPAELRTTLLLADCRLRLGEYDKVQELLLPVEAAQPEDRTTQYLLGLAFVRSGRTSEGQRRVEALMRGGDSAEAQYLLGSASFVAKDYPKAVEHLGRALAQQPELPSLRSAYGQALLFTGDPDGAEQAFRAALRDTPNDYEAAFYLASILAQRQKLAEARPLAERALQLRPRSAEAQQLLASLDRPSAEARPAAAESPLVGLAAPEVTWRRADGATERLSSLLGHPLLLAFGSFTCPQFRHGAPVLNDLYRRFHDRVEFRLVYIREAHPQGEWQSTINARQGVSLAEARSPGERGEHAALCRERLQIPYQAVVDDMDGRAEKAFSAFPSHAFVLDGTGKVTYATPLDEESLQPEALAAALAAVAR